MLIKDKHSGAAWRQDRFCTHETGNEHDFAMSQDHSGNRLSEPRGLAARIKGAPEHLVLAANYACDYHLQNGPAARGVQT